MKSDQMWQAYKILNQTIGDKIDAWAFGVEADYLAELVLMGQKTATSSAFDLYAVGNEPLPKENELSVILDSKENAICIIETTKVEVQLCWKNLEWFILQIESSHSFGDFFYFKERLTFL